LTKADCSRSKAVLFPVVQFRTMAHMTAVLRHLERERTRVTAQLDQVGNALAALKGSSTSKRHTLSAAGRARVRAAQKARWAKWRKAHEKR